MKKKCWIWKQIAAVEDAYEEIIGYRCEVSKDTDVSSFVYHLDMFMKSLKMKMKRNYSRKVSNYTNRNLVKLIASKSLPILLSQIPLYVSVIH